MRVSTLLLVLFPVARAPHIQEYYDVTISPQYVSPSTHAYRCCTTDTLYVAVEQTPVGTTSGIGPYGMRPFKNDADVWTGVLPDMLRAMAQQTGMNLVFIEAARDCSNEIFLWDWTWAYYCTLRATNESVPLARFITHNDDVHHSWDLPFQQRYVTTSFAEHQTAVLLSVEDAGGYGWWQFIAPFTWDLWVAMIVSIVGLSLLIPSTIRDGATHKTIVSGGGATGLRTKPLVRLEMLYHSSVMYFGGDDLEWTPNLSSRMLRMGQLFLVLISTSSCGRRGLDPSLLLYSVARVATDRTQC